MQIRPGLEVTEGGSVEASDQATLGIVIPTLEEEAELPLLLEDLRQLSLPYRVVVSDGGSCDSTREKARDGGAWVMEAPRGRARQLNGGAAALRTPWLLFLHADVRVPPAAARRLEAWISEAGSDEFGTFAFSLEGDQAFWRFIEMGQKVREKLHGLAYGDQGLVLSRSLFQKVGGFPEVPVMEDVEILRRLKRAGRWRKIRALLVASPRRYREEGRWRSWLRNTALIALYLVGISPHRMKAFYPARTGTRREGSAPPSQGPHASLADADREAREGKPRRDQSPGRILLVFAKEPAPGRVKTRLAREVGEAEAARIYSGMGRGIVDRVRTGRYRTRVCFDPPGAGETMVRWLGGEGLEFASQARGDLGARLESAFQEALASFPQVVVIGTDTPGVDKALVEQAFQALERSDLVLGPASDGGYYLLGLRAETSELFRGIPWSTGQVLAETLARAWELGLTVVTLPTLPDIDSFEDWKAHRFGSGDGV